MNYFYLFNRLPIKEASILLKRMQGMPPVSFLEHQESAKWSIFQHHIENNRFYNKLCKNRVTKRWLDIPILQKSDIQLPLENILSSGYTTKNVYKNNTSGSTGKPFHFAKDKFSHAMTWAYIINRYNELGITYGESLQARFFGIPLSRSKHLKETVKDWVSARVRFPIFDLSDAQLQKYLESFYKRRFVYVYGYTSSLVLFAKYLINSTIVLKDICPSLQWCIVTSEVCSSSDRALLEVAFGLKVINEYGAAELDIIAFEDHDGDWLLNEENLFIEVVDNAGQPVADGESGNVVVTSLYNKAMPFIRYNLGDVVKLKTLRKGHTRMIDTLAGRVNDIAILPSGKKSPGLTFYYVSKELLEVGGFIKEFTIKQLKVDHFHFDYVATTELTDDQKNKVISMMDKYLEPNLRATFERTTEIRRSASGKFRQFQNLTSK